MSTNFPQLFLLHYAGGNCYSFAFVKPFLENQFEFIPIELPGRGRRMAEPLLIDKSPAIEDLIRQIKHLRKKDVPYCIYGHSMGAALALDIVAIMESTDDSPQALIVSGYAGPGSTTAKCRHQLSDEAFREELKQLGGMPQEILDNDELYEFFAPILRADFQVVDTSHDAEPPVLEKTPILALMGTTEENAEKIDNWQNYTLAHYSGSILEGNHFFIFDHAPELAKQIRSCYDGNLVL